MTNSKHTEEFKRQAVELVAQLGSVAQAARQFGITDSNLYNWKDKYRPDLKLSPNKGSQQIPSSNESEEVKRLRKENEELKKVNYILKKAAAFFSQDHLK